MKKIEPGNAACMFVIQLVESYILIECYQRIKAQQRGLPKIGSKCDPCVLRKGDLKGKMAMFGGFSRNFFSKN